jgi:hypothetical protein
MADSEYNAEEAAGMLSPVPFLLAPPSMVHVLELALDSAFTAPKGQC